MKTVTVYCVEDTVYCLFCTNSYDRSISGPREEIKRFLDVPFLVCPSCGEGNGSAINANRVSVMDFCGIRAHRPTVWKAYKRAGACRWRRLAASALCTLGFLGGWSPDEATAPYGWVAA